jgi:diacylglycerol kinase (ATP)
MEELVAIRHLFIINPAAGKRGSTDALVAQIHQVFSPGSDPYDILFTQGPGDAARYACQAAQSGEDVRIYACGGDGTLNEVVNGAAGYSNAAVTNVPKGTGNDFLKIFGPQSRARFSDLAALAVGPQSLFDLMDCNGKLGIGVVCAGVDARIAADVHHYKALPLITGIGAYLLSLVVNVLFKGISRPGIVEMGPHRFQGEVAVLCVCNGRYYGGGFMPVGDAMPDDGVLDILLVPRVSRFTFFRLVGEYARGRYRKYPQLIMAHHGRQVSFSSPQEITAVVDGEVLRDTSLTIQLAQQKVAFFYPADLSYVQKG